jgi:WD40 repeat protein
VCKRWRNSDGSLSDHSASPIGPDARRFATTGGDGFVRVWDWSSVKLIAERKVAPAHVSRVSYTGEGQRLVVSERAGAVYMIDGETVEVAGPRVPLNMRIFEVYGRDNRSAIAFDMDRFFVVDLEDGRVVHEGDFDLAPFRGDFSPDGRRFVSAASSARYGCSTSRPAHGSAHHAGPTTVSFNRSRTHPTASRSSVAALTERSCCGTLAPERSSAPWPPGWR